MDESETTFRSLGPPTRLGYGATLICFIKSPSQGKFGKDRVWFRGKDKREDCG